MLIIIPNINQYARCQMILFNLVIFSSDKHSFMEQQNHGKILVIALYAFKAQNTDEVNHSFLHF